MRAQAFGCFCRPPPGKNPPRYQCPADGSPIAGNCSADSASKDGMIGKAVSAARAVKSSPRKACRLSLGVETSCFKAADSDKQYEFKLSFCGTSSAYLAEQMERTAAGLDELGLWRGVVEVRPASTFVPCRSFSHTNLKSPCVEQATMPFVVEDYKALRLLEQATGP